MTFIEFLKEQLVANGMFESQADAVIKIYLEDEAANNSPMTGRFNDDVSDYPPVMKNMTLIVCKCHALKYIDDTIPQAWFRPMFLPQ